MNALPHDLHAEKTVIGFMLFGQYMHAILSELQPEDFYATAHRAIASACIDLFKQGQPVDVLTVAEQMYRDKTIEAAGGREYLGECVQMAFSDELLDGAISIVKDAALLRHGYAASVSASSRFANPSERAEELIAEYQTNLLNLTSRNNRAKIIDNNTAIEKAFSQIDANSKAEPTGIATGFHDIDFKTGGLQRGELIILAARPSMGKTSLMLNIAANVAKAGKHVHIFTLEMTARALAWRLLFGEAKVDMHLGKTGKIREIEHDQELQRVHDAFASLQNIPLYYNETSFNIMEICSFAQREAVTRGVDLICLDYLGLAHSGLRGVSRNDEIGFMTGNLKRLAKELNVPVLCLSQLSRINENQGNRRPTLNALRDSGNIEQDTDVAMFLYSDEYYQQDKSQPAPTEWDSTLIIAKQRNGPTGDIELKYCRQFTRFFGTHPRDEKKDEIAVPDYQYN